MTAVEMPRFDFSGSAIKDDEELQSQVDKSTKGSKFFAPGRYDVTIESVTYKGLAKDPNWGALEVVYKGTGDKTIKDQVQIPFKDFKFNGERGETMFPFKKVQAFAGALGVEIKRTNAEEALKTLFARPEKLAGRPLKIEVGYRKAYAKYVGKEGDQKVYNLAHRDGTLESDANGAVKFYDYESVEAYANQKNIGFDKFVNVLAYEKSSDTGLAPESGW